MRTLCAELFQIDRYRLSRSTPRPFGIKQKRPFISGIRAETDVPHREVGTGVVDCDVAVEQVYAMIPDIRRAGRLSVSETVSKLSRNLADAASVSDAAMPALERAGDGLAEGMPHNTAFAPLFTASLMLAPLVKTQNRLFPTMWNRQSGDALWATLRS